MSKKRYKSDYDVVAYRAIAIGGIDRAAYESIGVSDRCFYAWMSKHDSFRLAVEKGREFHQRSSPEALKLALVSYIVSVLESGGERVVTRQRVTNRLVRRDHSDRIIMVEENEVITETEEFKGISKWIADKIIANASGLNEAINKVINAGYEVVEVDKYLLNEAEKN